MTPTPLSPPPAVDTARIRALLERELALPARLGHLLLLLASLAMSITVASLWLTEPGLPARTELAFAAMTLIGVSWAGYAGWVLRRRRVLYGRQRVVAGRLAVAFSALFTAGALAVALGGRPAAAAAAGFGTLMLAIAVLALRRAHEHREALLLLRATLEHELGAA